jgi:hypothetical protein
VIPSPVASPAHIETVLNVGVRARLKSAQNDTNFARQSIRIGSQADHALCLSLQELLIKILAKGE